MESIIAELVKMYGELKEKAINDGVYSVIEIPSSQICEETDALFAEYGISFDALAISSVSEETAKDYNKLGAKGFTTFINQSGSLKSVIFVGNDCGNEIEAPLTMCATLAHELGHHHDFLKRQNYTESAICKNLVKAEGYAEVFSLNYFHHLSSPLSYWVKGNYAKVLLERRLQGGFYSEVHKEIIKSISESRLKTWKKAI
jgi:hypothetical protein